MKKIKNNGIVVYNNDMNLVPLRKFTSNEQDLFYAICMRMRDEGISTVQISFDEIKEMCNFQRKDISAEMFAQELLTIYKKLLSITCAYTIGKKMFGFVLFTDYMIDEQKKIAEISVNSKFSYLLNDLTKNFTRFEMLEFASLSSSYSKTAYKLLKQYQSTGKLILSMEAFREQFCIPKSYQMSDINKVVLKPILNELPIYFKKLKIEKQANGKGKTITHIEFTFKLKQYQSTGKPQDKMFLNKEQVSHGNSPEMDELERRLIEKRETVNRMYEKDSI